MHEVNMRKWMKEVGAKEYTEAELERIANSIVIV